MTRELGMGFTLIELLVVIGILSILAAIGMGNYSAATQRAKCSRVYSDLRTIAGAIEAYTTDHSRPPRMAHYKFYRDDSWDVVFGERVQGVCSKAISTPISYMQQAYIMDPFLAPIHKSAVEERLYTYQVLPVYAERSPKSAFWPNAVVYYGQWRLGSSGPDLSFDHGFKNSAQLPYDPTNGGVSLGNLWYAQRGGIRADMPPQNLLGKH